MHGSAFFLFLKNKKRFTRTGSRTQNLKLRRLARWSILLYGRFAFLSFKEILRQHISASLFDPRLADS